MKNEDLIKFIFFGFLVVILLTAFFLFGRGFFSGLTVADNSLSKCSDVHIEVVKADSKTGRVILQRDSGGDSERIYGVVYIDGKERAITGTDIPENGIYSANIEEGFEEGSVVSVGVLIGDKVCSLSAEVTAI